MTPAVSLPGLLRPDHHADHDDPRTWSDLTMMTTRPLSRREFVGTSLAACSVGALSRAAAAASESLPRDQELDFPLVDLHAHLDNSSIDQVLPLAAERHVRFGIVEHAGTKENKYPKVLSTDEELIGYLEMLEGKGVYKGVQAEWTDWMTCFSPEALARLDYVLTDAMTFPGKDGQRVKLWEKSAEDQVDMQQPRGLHGPLRRLACRDHVHRAVRHPGQRLLASRRPVPRVRQPLDGAADAEGPRRGAQVPARHRDQLQLQAPRLAFLKQAKAAGRQVQLRLQRPLPQHGQARLQHRHGQGHRAYGPRYVHAFGGK